MKSLYRPLAAKPQPGSLPKFKPNPLSKMNKIWVIFAREYMQRVKSKGFVLGTLLAPLGMVLLIAIPVAITGMASEDTEKVMAVVDESGLLYEKLAFMDPARLDLWTGSVDTLRARVQRGALEGYLILPQSLLSGTGEAQYYSQGGGGIVFRERLERAISKAVSESRALEAGVSEEVVKMMNERTSLKTIKVTDEGDTEDAAGFLAGLGYVMGFLIYICLFIYGALVMRGVIEEKTSRIMEVVVSSARPFQLMLGKVLGIGAMGLTQLVCWVLVSMGLMVAAGPLIASFMDPANLNLPDAASQEEILQAADISIPEIPIALFVYFLLFFLGGYLLFSSLFAAVGSAVDQESDAQQLMIPVSLLIIVPILFMQLMLENPDSGAAVVLSLVPFFSPILMVARVAATQVPFWQVGLSLVLLYAGFIGCVWVGSRIYRVGILMYGKKPSIKDLIRWARYA